MQRLSPVLYIQRHYDNRRESEEVLGGTDMTLETNKLFATPESKEEFVLWLDEFKGEEKMIALTAASMAWNLAAKLVNEENANA